VSYTSLYGVPGYGPPPYLGTDAIDTRHLRGMQLGGLNIVVSSWMTPVPAVSLSHDFTAASDECIADMNAWLLEQFGTREQVFRLDGNTLVVSHKTYQLLREMA
jgi:hypothetical protein